MTQIVSLVKKEKYRLTGAVGLLFISSGVTLTVPLIFGKIIDFISTGRKPDGIVMNALRFFNFKSITDDSSKNSEIDKKDIKKFCALTFVFFVIGGLANFGRFYLIQTAGQRIVLNLRSKLYSTLINKPVEFFDRNQSGELISRITADTTVIGEGLSNNISNGLRSSLQMGMGMGMMMYVSPQLSFLSLFVLPPVAGSAFIFGRYIKKISSSLQESVALSTEKASESLSAIRTVKAFCREKKEINSYESSIRDILVNVYRDALLRGSFFGLMGMSGNILVVSMLLYGGSLISAGQLTIGDLSSFLIYAAYAMISIGGVGTFYTELMKTAGSGSRLWKWMDEETKTIESLKNQLSYSNSQYALGDIKFENVFFSYPTRPNQIILNDFSLCIPEGKITAIIGPSGCGKSSLVSLLLKFYKIDSGKLLIGDKSINSINDYVWKQKIAAVLQDPILFSCSIAENIAYGARSDSDPTLTLSNIERIAQIAQVMEFAKDLPNGLDTKIGERGVLLSGGQRQRIAIARALMSDPDIVIFDEAMSALDNEKEWLVQRAITEIFQGKTVLTISHRLAFLKSAHQIAIINKGKIVQLGSFEQLLETTSDDQNGNLFKKLLNNVY